MPRGDGFSDFLAARKSAGAHQVAYARQSICGAARTASPSPRSSTCRILLPRRTRDSGSGQGRLCGEEAPRSVCAQTYGRTPGRRHGSPRDRFAFADGDGQAPNPRGPPAYTPCCALHPRIPAAPPGVVVRVFAGIPPGYGGGKLHVVSNRRPSSLARSSILGLLGPSDLCPTQAYGALRIARGYPAV